MILLECTCGKKYSMKDGAAAPGSTVTCKACGNPITVPAAAGAGDSARIAQLERALANSQAEVQRLAEAQGASGDADARIAELEASMANLQDAEWQKSRAERDLSASKAALEMEQSGRKKAEAEIILRENKIKAMEEDLARARKAVELQPSVAEEIRLLKETMGAREAEVQRLRATIEERDQALANHKAELDEIRSREKWFESKISELEASLTTVQRELFEVRTQTQIRIKRTSEVREKALAARHFVFDLDRNLESLAASLRGLQERVHRLKDTLDVIEPPSPLPTPTPEETPLPNSLEAVAPEPAPAEAPKEELSETPPPVEEVAPAPESTEPEEAAPEPEEQVESAPAESDEPPSAEETSVEEAPAETPNEGDVPLIDMTGEEPAEAAPAPAEGESPAEGAPEEEAASSDEPQKKKGWLSRLFGKK